MRDWAALRLLLQEWQQLDSLLPNDCLLAKSWTQKLQPLHARGTSAANARGLDCIDVHNVLLVLESGLTEGPAHSLRSSDDCSLGSSKRAAESLAFSA